MGGELDPPPPPRRQRDGNFRETGAHPMELRRRADHRQRIRRNAPPTGPAVSLSRIADIRFEDNTFQLPGGGTPFAFVDSAEEAKMEKHQQQSGSS